MGKVILITGGSRSGKSTFAERLLQNRDDVLYIATAAVTDKEMEKRIKKHRERRNPKWETFEGYKGLHNIVDEYKHKYIMLECIGTMITNIIFDEECDFDNMCAEDIEKLRDDIKRQIEEFIKSVKEKDREVIIVTNEVGWSLVPEYKLGRIFSDILGYLNQFIGSVSDEVYLVACGFPMKLK